MKPRYKIRYQIKWTTKGQEIVDEKELKSLLLKISKELKIQIIEMKIEKTTVLLKLSSPPSISVSNIVKRLKGKTSRIINIKWETGYICKTTE